MRSEVYGSAGGRRRKVAGKQRAGEGPTGGWGWGAREELTKNIWFMFVTLEVAQLEMSASKFSNSLKR